MTNRATRLVIVFAVAAVAMALPVLHRVERADAGARAALRDHQRADRHRRRARQSRRARS